jgi:hypothetical protein
MLQYECSSYDDEFVFVVLYKFYKFGVQSLLVSFQI